MLRVILEAISESTKLTRSFIMGLFEQAQEQVLNMVGKANPQAAEMAKNLFAQTGGVSGLVQKFQDGGMKDTVQSWIGTGANTPITPEQITKILGTEKVISIAQKIGVNPETVAQQLSQHLPTVIDKLTPAGQLPTAGNMMTNVLNMAKGFFGGTKH
jgi:uncharacterized protein YidB (DUF937 family)